MSAVSTTESATNRISYLPSSVAQKEEASRKLSDKFLRPVRYYFQTVGRLFPHKAAKRAYYFFTTPKNRVQHGRTDALIDSAVRTTMDFRGDKVMLYSWGDSRRIVLLAHGWESRGTALRYYVPSLVEAGFRVVAYDALAHGDSEGTFNNLPTNAATIVAIYEHLQPEGDIEAAVCHSFGCSSITFALQYLKPEWALQRLAFIAVPNSVRHIIDHYITRLWVPKTTQKYFEQMLENVTKQKIDDLDVANAAGKVNVGALLLVHDQQDLVTTPEAAHHVLNKWQQARLILTEGYGHFRIAKNEDVVREVVRFIKK